MAYIEKYNSFEPINEASRISGKEIVYHGTSNNAWKKKYGNESTLFLTVDLSAAQGYADEMVECELLDEIKSKPVVYSITISQLKNISSITLEADWGAKGMKEDKTWQDSFLKYGSFSIHGPIDDIKKKFDLVKVKADF